MKTIQTLCTVALLAGTSLSTACFFSPDEDKIDELFDTTPTTGTDTDTADEQTDDTSTGACAAGDTSGLGEVCTGQPTDCQDQCADYCVYHAQFKPVGYCTLQNCTTGSCPTGYTCCDCNTSTVLPPGVACIDSATAPQLGMAGCSCK